MRSQCERRMEAIGAEDEFWVFGWRRVIPIIYGTRTICVALNMSSSSREGKEHAEESKKKREVDGQRWAIHGKKILRAKRVRAVCVCVRVVRAFASKNPASVGAE